MRYESAARGKQDRIAYAGQACVKPYWRDGVSDRWRVYKLIAFQDVNEALDGDGAKALAAVAERDDA